MHEQKNHFCYLDVCTDIYFVSSRNEYKRLTLIEQLCIVFYFLFVF